MKSFLTGCALLGVLLAASDPSDAHVRLSDPPPRYEPTVDNNGYDDGEHLKEAPCGVTGDSRTTEASKITTYSPGETITLTWIETIYHPGHYRIAIDMDGQDDFTDPASQTDDLTGVGPVLLDQIPNPDGSGTEESAMVTLPNATCTNCTLQLIQVMTDRAVGQDIYHNCADIIIAGEVAASGGTSAGGTSAGGGSAGGSGGTSVGVDPIGGTGGTGGSVTTSPAGGTGTTKGKPSSDDVGGCSIAVPRAPRGVASLFLLLPAALLLRRKRG